MDAQVVTIIAIIMLQFSLSKVKNVDLAKESFSSNTAQTLGLFRRTMMELFSQDYYDN